MTYETNLQAAQQEATPEMYEFTAGSTEERITSYPSDLTFLGNSYSAKPIERGSFSYDSDFGSTAVKIKMLLTTDFKRFLSSQPIEPTNLKIYRALGSDLTDYVTLFNGQVKKVLIKDQTAQLDCESRSRYLEKHLPKYVYQAFCNHDVFDAGCTLVASTYKVTGTIVTISGSEITGSQWSNAAGYEDGYFQGGRVVFGSDMRLVVKHVDDTLTLQIPFSSVVTIGSSIDVYPGCDGNPATCINKYNNHEHFLGMPFIPSSNPTIFGFR